MINYHEQLVTALQGILPVYYEMTLTSDADIPCISYLELSNIEAHQGDTIGFSTLSYQVSIWGYSIADIQEYAQQIDNALRPLNFRREGSAELYDNNTGLIHKALTYDLLAPETY